MLFGCWGHIVTACEPSVESGSGPVQEHPVSSSWRGWELCWKMGAECYRLEGGSLDIFTLTISQIDKFPLSHTERQKLTQLIS